MSTKAAASPIAAPQWGSLALVTYLPEPLGSFLTTLRFELAGDLCLDDHNPEAHITFLPPRTLSVPVSQAALEVEQKLAGVEPFLCELGSVQVFPTTNMVYLSIGAASEKVKLLHCALNTGGLFAEERFQFIPHLTLGGPLAPAKFAALEKVESAWQNSGFSREFVVNELVLLWQADDQSQQDWNRLQTFALKSR